MLQHTTTNTPLHCPLTPPQELGRGNPQMLQQIQAHQAEFLAMINEPVEGAPQDLAAAIEQMAAEAGEGGEGMGGMGEPGRGAGHGV